MRLPHAEPDHDCGVCACAGCVQQWVLSCDNTELVCPRCRYPICAVHLKNVCGRSTARDPLIARLVSDVAAQCPYCDKQGTVATITSHTAKHCIDRHLATLHTMDATMQQARRGAVLMSPDDGSRWVDAFVALYALAPTEACHYLVQWMASTHAEGVHWGDTESYPICRLFLRLPIHVLDVCEIAWKKEAPPFSVATITRMGCWWTARHSWMRVVTRPHAIG